jgi:hypothetical protein
MLCSLNYELGYFLFEMSLLMLVSCPWMVVYPFLVQLESSILLSRLSSPTQLLFL